MGTKDVGARGLSPRAGIYGELLTEEARGELPPNSGQCEPHMWS